MDCIGFRITRFAPMDLAGRRGALGKFPSGRRPAAGGPYGPRKSKRAKGQGARARPPGPRVREAQAKKGVAGGAAFPIRQPSVPHVVIPSVPASDSPRPRSQAGRVGRRSDRGEDLHPEGPASTSRAVASASPRSESGATSRFSAMASASANAVAAASRSPASCSTRTRLVSS